MRLKLWVVLRSPLVLASGVERSVIIHLEAATPWKDGARRSGIFSFFFFSYLGVTLASITKSGPSMERAVSGPKGVNRSGAMDF